MDHSSLNLALAHTRFCPHCGAADPDVDFPRSLHCRACDHRAFYNPSPVAGAIPRTADGRIWLLRRGFHEGAGLWTFPGGFVDLGESVEDAARREAQEELEIDVELGDLVGVYSRADTRIVLVVYDAVAMGEPQTTPEATEVRAFTPEQLPWEDMAFWSTTQALKDLLARVPAA
jgi:ADP-ribose pyrophosphatase YjhB (NUDIX family)